MDVFIHRHELIIEAIDAGKPCLTGTATVTINVLDINDNAPVIQNVPYHTTIHEDTEIGTTVFHITATDDDAGPNAEIVYSLTSGDADQFVILRDTGHIRTVRKLDREAQEKYSIVITVTEVAKPYRTVSTTATIRVLDVNDNPPVFDPDHLTFYVQENVANDSFVGQVKATDLDTGRNAALLYTFGQSLKGSPNHFRIDPATGEIYALTGRLDRETVDLYKIYVVAQDDGSPPLTTEEIVTIMVTDHNDNIPSCYGSHFASIPEDTAPGHVIANMSIIDNDLGLNSELKYTIVNKSRADVQEYFDVDHVTGQLILTKALDRELIPQYQFKVKVEDRGSPALSSECDVVVIVEDVNDNAPFFEPDFYSVDVANTEDYGHHIVQVTAHDYDTGDNSVVHYEFGQEYMEFHLGIHSGMYTLDGHGLDLRF